MDGRGGRREVLYRSKSKSSTQCCGQICSSQKKQKISAIPSLFFNMEIVGHHDPSMPSRRWEPLVAASVPAKQCSHSTPENHQALEHHGNLEKINDLLYRYLVVAPPKNNRHATSNENSEQMNMSLFSGGRHFATAVKQMSTSSSSSSSSSSSRRVITSES